MRLHELAFCCRVYGVCGSYDAALGELREQTGDIVVIERPEHRTALFRWLRAMKCRQFVERDEAVATEHLLDWWATYGGSLPPPASTLDELADEELDAIATAFEALRWASCGWQMHTGGRQVPKRFGPVGAAKTLYAVRPNACSPWDRPIQMHFGHPPTGSGYRAHLHHVRQQLAEAVRDLPEGDASTLPALLERPLSSPAKLVDEHDWVRYTRGGDPPTPEMLQQWARWATPPE
jgi:hypothetical protein